MLRGVLRVAAAFVVSAVPAFGQRAVAELNGSTVDQTGAALPGATITITDTLNFTLPMGALTDVVTVTGEAPLLEVTQTQSNKAFFFNVDEKLLAANSCSTPAAPRSGTSPEQLKQLNQERRRQ
ncbi:MAG: hypothetical protein ACRD3C_12775 [Vicinamibacterales bacterium]